MTDFKLELTDHRDGYSPATFHITLNGAMMLARALSMLEPEPWEQDLHRRMLNTLNKRLTDAIEVTIKEQKQ